ncbi:MAG: septum formation initiator family protein [Nocardiopsaceae bacterium]|nr:septum formation initiator family protein [Nocardiopsaceae bacterium]
MICVIALSLAYPLREYVAQRAEIAGLQDQRAQTRENVSDLEERREQMQDPAYIEREARTRLHYQYPGEQAYVVISGDDEESGHEDSSAKPEPWFTRLWKSVQGADAADTEQEEIPEARPPERG